jgi:SAM-dependent methyltransferase
MSEQRPAWDPIWEQEIYGAGRHLSRWPYDVVVSFVFRHHPRGKPRSEVRILEIGCGTGNNLWFAAREGFAVAGIDGSRSAIEYARKRFAEDGLQGDLRVGDFAALPFDTDTYDLAIDRGALTCCGRSVARRAAEEVRRVLVPGGKFFFNPYSDRHTSAHSGRPGPDGLTLDVAAGTLVRVGQLCFWGRQDVLELFAKGWGLLSLEHLEIVQQIHPQGEVHAEWRGIAQKPVEGAGRE